MQGAAAESGGHAEPAQDTSGGPVAVIETGSFARAKCTGCGWQGPGRRARSGAAGDAELHQLTGCVPPVEAVAQVRTVQERAQSPAH
ncbi:hypothetical protein [Gephyromycinifex aptenodytis]|uniref:hypothetical protein n=1 Tax=Gephyromycinifex aptenodytis TaxID=2716227 RepID=UPI001446AA5E|nr:hypothetical protein [Gephyromycinifex aptenodytis]